MAGAPCAPQVACWASMVCRSTARHAAPAPAGAIKKWRALIGPTDSIKARGEAPQSLRARFGTDGTQNACHGSDAPDTAAEELSFFFARNTLGGLSSGMFSWGLGGHCCLEGQTHALMAKQCHCWLVLRYTVLMLAWQPANLLCRESISLAADCKLPTYTTSMVLQGDACRAKTPACASSSPTLCGRGRQAQSWRPCSSNSS